MAHSTREPDERELDSRPGNAPRPSVLARSLDVFWQWVVVSALGVAALMLLPLVFLGPSAAMDSYERLSTGSWPDFDGFPGPAHVIAFVFAIGAPIVLFYGAPAYVLLWRKKWASCWPVFLVGCAPGLLIPMLPVFAGYGAFVALVTHAAYVGLEDPSRLHGPRGRAYWRARLAERRALRASGGRAAARLD